MLTSQYFSEMEDQKRDKAYNDLKEKTFFVESIGVLL